MPVNPVTIIETQRPLQIHCPFNGAEYTFNLQTDLEKIEKEK